jgi:hypothetical protein
MNVLVPVIVYSYFYKFIIEALAAVSAEVLTKIAEI